MFESKIVRYGISISLLVFSLMSLFLVKEDWQVLATQFFPNWEWYQVKFLFSVLLLALPYFVYIIVKLIRM